METISSQYPIIEAVCEFRLPKNIKWDLTIPGLLFSKVANSFPDNEQRVVQSVEIIQNSEGVKHQISRDDRVFFYTPDRKTFIQIGTRMLAIHCIKPYPGWDNFKPKITEAFHAFADIIDFSALERIGLRYINQIKIPGNDIPLKNYFEFRPHFSKDLANNLENFIMNCIFTFFDGSDSCRVQLTNMNSSKSDTITLMLDIDYYLAKPNTVSKIEALHWMERAKEQINNIFNKCITGNLKNKFKEIA
jgi:uncharacterized protein (TIGR04255 family)